VNRGRLCGDRRGLTLIELVLTLTILALAGGLVSGALMTGLRAWRSGLRSGREELVARIALERIAGQLRAAVGSPAKKSEADAVAFDAGEHLLRFVTLSGEGGAPVQVAYALRDEGGAPHLVYREYAWPDKDFFSDEHPRREEVVEEISGFTVKVTRREEKQKAATGPTANVPAAGETHTLAEWSPLDKVLPASVSVEIAVSAEGQSEPRTYRVDVPILAQQVK
jgi:prepilin-type N-terminal cleavage/methylation domain-containing protein